MNPYVPPPKPWWQEPKIQTLLVAGAVLIGLALFFGRGWLKSTESATQTQPTGTTERIAP